MASRILIRLDTDPQGPVAWQHQDGAGQRLGGGVSNDLAELAQLSREAPEARLIALAAGTQVLLTRITIPTQNRTKLLRAVPFALEDQLADDVGRLHFALGKREADGAWPVAVVERGWLDDWLARLDEHGLGLARLIPEVLCLPRLGGSPGSADGGQWTVLTEDATALVRTGDQRGFAGDRPNLDTLLSLALDEPGMEPPGELLYLADPRAEALELPPELTGVTLSRQAAGDLLALFGRQVNDPLAINLLTGDYAPKRKTTASHLRPWAAVAALFMAWLVLDTGHTVLEQRSMRAQLASLDSQVLTLYRQVFPQARDSAQARTRVEGRLSQLRGGGGGQSGADLVDTLLLLGPVLQAGDNITVNGMTWRAGSLELELSTANLQSLDRLKQNLDGTDGLSAEVRSARSEDDRTQGRLLVKRSGQ